MGRVALVTDSTAHLQVGAESACDVSVVPLQVVIDDEVYDDDGNWFGRGKDTFEGPVANADEFVISILFLSIILGHWLIVVYSASISS